MVPRTLRSIDNKTWEEKLNNTQFFQQRTRNLATKAKSFAARAATVSVKRGDNTSVCVGVVAHLWGRGAWLWYCLVDVPCGVASVGEGGNEWSWCWGQTTVCFKHLFSKGSQWIITNTLVHELFLPGLKEIPRLWFFRQNKTSARLPASCFNFWNVGRIGVDLFCRKWTTIKVNMKLLSLNTDSRAAMSECKQETVVSKVHRLALVFSRDWNTQIALHSSLVQKQRLLIKGDALYETYFCLCCACAPSCEQWKPTVELWDPTVRKSTATLRCSGQFWRSNTFPLNSYNSSQFPFWLTKGFGINKIEVTPVGPREITFDTTSKVTKAYDGHPGKANTASRTRSCWFV